MNLVFGISIIVFIVVILLIRNHESKDRKNDELSGGKIIHKKHWSSMWIDGTLHKQMMTLVFRETCLVIYQTFSARTVFRIQYSGITKTDQQDIFKRTDYMFTDEGKSRIVRFCNPEEEVLDVMIEKQKSNQSIEPIVKTPGESGKAQSTQAHA